MKETYYVGFDPAIKQWDASPITHEFDENTWVFKTQARSAPDALAKGVDKYRELMIPPCVNETAVIKHIVKQVGKQARTSYERMIIEIPAALAESVSTMAKRGFFDAIHGDEIVLEMNSAGWKAIEHLNTSKPLQRRHTREIAGLAL